jgi:hypothetical protein
MLVKKIIYIDSNIKVCCIKNTKAELKRLCPRLMQHIFFKYSIGLEHNPASRVQETIKIEPKDIKCAKNYIIFSFHLDGLLKPTECDFTIHSITFFLKNVPRFKIDIGITKSFRYIESDPTLIDNLLTKEEKIPGHRNTKNKSSMKNTSKNSLPAVTPSPESKGNLDDIKHFMDSYEKFKAQFKEAEINTILENKPSAIEFKMKSFGISLLCKLLLLIKSVNELVDNDFQKDLHEFLQAQILNRLEPEVTA